MDIREIGKRIRTVRLEKNLKLESVAAKASMSATGYGNIERGGCRTFSLHRFISIANALDVSVIELLPIELTSAVSITAHQTCIADKDKEIERLKAQLASLQNCKV